MHRLPAPAARDHLGCEPVQQFRMTRPITDRAKVARRADDSFAEVILPDSIHHYARGEGILGAGDEIGQLFATMNESDVGSACENRRETRLNLRPLLTEVAAFEHECLDRFIVV